MTLYEKKGLHLQRKRFGNDVPSDGEEGGKKV
jgi:hypothetical protein